MSGGQTMIWAITKSDILRAGGFIFFISHPLIVAAITKQFVGQARRVLRSFLIYSSQCVSVMALYESAPVVAGVAESR